MSDPSRREVEIRSDPRLDVAEICALRASVGWDRLEGDYPSAFQGYWGSVGAFDSAGRLVGWCAIVSDGVRHAFLVDVIVHPGWQRRGVGKRIVKEAVSRIRREGISVIHVDFVPEYAQFYERCGFRIGLGGIYDND